MSAFSTEPLSGPQPPQVTGLSQHPPGVVYASAVLTLVVATGTAALTVVLAVGLLLVADPLFDVFESGADNPRWWVVGAAAVVVALSAAADVVAVFMLRGHRWARWVLAVLSVVAAVGGLMAAYYIVPLVVTGAAVAVLVLLFLPGARSWFRSSRMPEGAAAR